MSERKEDRTNARQNERMTDIPKERNQTT